MKTMIAAALILTTAAAPVAAQLSAQTPPATTSSPSTPSPGGGLLERAGGLLGGAMPSIGSIGAGNAAGLLGYCLKNKLLGATGTTGTTSGAATGAAGVLGRLAGQKDVKTSPGYSAGQAGQVQAPNGQTLSLGSLRGQVKNQMCNLVLSRARSFL